ncbi:MAG: hypothetical protein ACI89U_000335 [Gammaproteobacteria bacterium]|jgi:hypothetical protein
MMSIRCVILGKVDQHIQLCYCSFDLWVRFNEVG